MYSSKISVALCTHNGASYIAEQIASICNQIMLPDEIVLSDDASSDNTIRIAQAELENCAPCGRPALRILRNDAPLGVTANFEKAIGACTGELIILCDQDDVWEAGRMAKITLEFERCPELLLLHSDALLVDKHGYSLGQTLFYALEVKRFEIDWLHNGRAFDVYLRRNLATGATTVFRQSLLAAARPFPLTWLHDEWLAAIASSIGKVDVIDEPLIKYRQHGRNLIGARRLSLLESVRKAFASRGVTHIQRAGKTVAWLERLKQLDAAGMPVDQLKIAQLASRLHHQEFRATLPPNRFARLWPVLKEMKTGRYQQFGRGVRGVVRDLLESI